MKSLTAILIDDEPHSLGALEIQLSKYCPQIEITASCKTAESGLVAIKASPPDLVFLDIEMPHLNGFQLLDQLKDINFKIIFTTAYDQFAITAFKYSALDYLLKPIDAEDLIKAVQKAVDYKNNQLPQIELLKQNYKNGKPSKIALAYQDGYTFINPDEIIYCESDSNYTKFHLNSGNTLVAAKTLKDVENVLENLDFCRIHKQYLVNLNHIKKYVKNEGSYVIMTNQANLPISRSHKDEFNRLFIKF